MELESAAFLHGYKGPMATAGVQLPWPVDFGVLVFVHFFPLGDPAGQPAQGEHYGEHIGGNAQCPVDNEKKKKQRRHQIMRR